MNWVHPLSLICGSVVIVFADASLGGIRNWLGAQPELLPVLVVYAALHSGLATTTTTAVLGALTYDALSAGPCGISVAPMVFLGVLLHRRRDVLLKESTWAQVLLGGGAALAVNGLSFVLIFVFWPLMADADNEAAFWPEAHQGLTALPTWNLSTLWQFLFIAVTAAVTTPAVFRLFRWIEATCHYQPVARPVFRADREIDRGRF